jgi:hypothetical protein
VRTCILNKAQIFHQVDSFVTLTDAMQAIKDRTNIMQTYMLRLHSKKLNLHLSSLNPQQAYS